MKKYKRTRIVASLAVISSLAFTSSTFGATSIPIGSANTTNTKHPTYLNTYRSPRAHKEIKTKRLSGFISAIQEHGFTLKDRIVITTENTIYMRKGKLDASVEPAVGLKVSVIGIPGADGTFEAKGINFITSTS